MGNLHSVESALQNVGAERVIVSSNVEEIRQADRVVFPGVGGMRDCIGEICRLGFDTLVTELLMDRPVLAICVGMQALLARSEENGGVGCLNLIDGDVHFFGDSLRDTSGSQLKVPHMGWNRVEQTIDHPLWQGIENGSRFYFLHSYYVHAKNRDLVAGSCEYGIEIDAALSQKNLFAVQFHPEKSHTAGLQLLSNFVSWNGQR
jgi:glutamine amidotransferase